MDTVASVITGGGNDEDAPLSTKAKCILKMLVDFRRRHQLTGADIDDRRTALDGDGHSMGNGDLGSGAAAVPPPEKDRQRQTTASGRQPGMIGGATKDQAADIGSMRIRLLQPLRHHRIHDRKIRIRQRRTAQVRQTVDHRDGDPAVASADASNLLQHPHNPLQFIRVHLSYS